MTEEELNAVSPPYISFKTFLNLMDRLAEGGIPQRIDRSYWSSFLSGSVGVQVIAALRFFSLIAGPHNEPTPDLERLVENKEQRKQTLAEMLKKFYASVFSEVDLGRATTGHLAKTFETCYGKLSVETRRKSIAFFLHAAEYAGFTLSTHLKNASRTRSTATRSANRTNSKKIQHAGNGSANPENGSAKSRQHSSVPPPLSKNGSTKTITLRSGGEVGLNFSLDWINIDPEDRMFVFRLIDQLKDYEQGIVNDEDEEEEFLEEEEE